MNKNYNVVVRRKDNGREAVVEDIEAANPEEAGYMALDWAVAETDIHALAEDLEVVEVTEVPAS
jgi:hypothetical protein